MDPRLFWHLILRSTIQITESVCLALLSQWSACQLDANTATDSAFLLAGRGLGKASVWIFLLECNITATQCANQLLCVKSQLVLLMYWSSYSTLRLYHSHRKCTSSNTARKLYFPEHYNRNSLYQPRASHAWFNLSYIHLHIINSWQPAR